MAKSIPEKIRKHVDEIVKALNQKMSKDPRCFYTTKFKGTYPYLDRVDYEVTTHICRLKFMGRIDNWEFAIYKYSDNGYDPDEWMFPGTEQIDGTIEGAMKAGLEAYPP